MSIINFVVNSNNDFFSSSIVYLSVIYWYVHLQHSFYYEFIMIVSFDKHYMVVQQPVLVFIILIMINLMYLVLVVVKVIKIWIVNNNNNHNLKINYRNNNNNNKQNQMDHHQQPLLICHINRYPINFHSLSIQQQQHQTNNNSKIYIQLFLN